MRHGWFVGVVLSTTVGACAGDSSDADALSEASVVPSTGPGVASSSAPPGMSEPPDATTAGADPLDSSGGTSAADSPDEPEPAVPEAGSSNGGAAGTPPMSAGGAGGQGEDVSGGGSPETPGGSGGLGDSGGTAADPPNRGGGGAGGNETGGSGGDDSPPEEVDQSQLPNVTLHLAGDSTVMTYEPSSAQEGWGQELGPFFVDKVEINNQAIGGASIRTFQTGRWQNIMSVLGAGDTVMIQFGANDSGTVAGRHVDPPDFALALNEMVDDVESQQATAIFVTPSALQEWSGDVQGNMRLGPYADAMRELGPMRGVLVDDLNARSVEYLNMIGQTAAQEIYIGGDKAHFTKTGAIQMAQFVAEELDRIESPLAAYLMR